LGFFLIRPRLWWRVSRKRGGVLAPISNREKSLGDWNLSPPRLSCVLTASFFQQWVGVYRKKKSLFSPKCLTYRKIFPIL
jgi:hypothetical protein